MIDLDKLEQEQHDEAHNLAGALQEALEDFISEHPLTPHAILLGIAIFMSGWLRFLSGKIPGSDLVALQAQAAISCCGKLFTYLQTNGKRLLNASPLAVDDDEIEINVPGCGEA